MANELSFLDAAMWWLDQGFELLPCQPGSKRLVKGFGLHKQRVVTKDQAAHWWHAGSHANIAAVCQGESFILDFDDLELYTSWAAEVGSLWITYTENTPRGGRHAFYRGAVPRGVTLREGAELKSTCLVAPSVVKGRAYLRGARDIREVDAVKTLSPLSKPGARTPHLLQTIEISEAAAALRARVRVRETSAVDQIKAHFRVLPLLEINVPGFAVFGSGRFVSARCPFHKEGKENHPSMWIDLERQLWGCHACPAHGDVINLVARLRGISNREAIAYLGDLLP